MNLCPIAFCQVLASRKYLIAQCVQLLTAAGVRYRVSKNGRRLDCWSVPEDVWRQIEKLVAG